MMKRILSIWLIALLLAAVFVGCTPRTAVIEGETDAAVTTLPTTSPTRPEDPADAPSPLMWKVTGEGGGTLYLFGTIHVGDERTGQVLYRVQDTLAACDALAVEFDTVAYEQDTARVTRDLQQFVYTDGTAVTDHMPENIYKAAKALFTRAGMSNAYLDVYNVAMWSMFVEQAAMQVHSHLQAERGMDNLLIHKAYELDIPVWEVESADLQYGLMKEFSDELYCLQMRQTLKMGKEYGKRLNALYTAWLYGNIEEALEEEDETDEQELTERQIALLTAYNEKMLDERNAGMAKKAEEYLQAGNTVFFAVGAAHMAGDAGVVQLLRDAGYTVELYRDIFE